MLFSTKPSPNWLDRLRSNKGFSAADDSLDLDHFLQPNPTSDSPNPNASSTPTRPGEAMLGPMTTAISELFFIDGADERSRFNGEKLPRKQTHPRVCVISSISAKHKSSSAGIGHDVADDVTTTVPFTSKNVEDEDEERGERELRGYSKSEVTVIDTSCEVWKTEKVVFRRKSVWKVREKKCKVRSFGRNKRKDVGDDDDGVEEKKKKRKEVSQDQCVSRNPVVENDARKEVREDTTDNINDRVKEFCKDNMPDHRKDLEKSFPLKPRKTIKEGSSVYFIKGIPTDDKNEGKLPKKNGHKKYKA